MKFSIAARWCELGMRFLKFLSPSLKSTYSAQASNVMRAPNLKIFPQFIWGGREVKSQLCLVSPEMLFPYFCGGGGGVTFPRILRGDFWGVNVQILTTFCYRTEMLYASQIVSVWRLIMNSINSVWTCISRDIHSRECLFKYFRWQRYMQTFWQNWTEKKHLYNTAKIIHLCMSSIVIGKGKVHPNSS